MWCTSGAHKLQFPVGTMSLMMVQFGRTEPSLIQGPVREGAVKIGMWLPVAKT